MARKILLLLVIGIICGISYFCIRNLIVPSNDAAEVIDPTKLFHGKMSFYANSLEEVYEQSSIIIEATIGERINEVEFGPESYFIFTEAKVDTIIKGNGFNKWDRINIIQTKYLIEDPALEKGTEKILFLLKYDNKEYADNDDTYACVGGYQGVYDINRDGTVSNSLNREDLSPDAADMFRDFAEGKSRKEFVNKILNFN